MVQQFFKKKSKRVSTRTRVKIEKKVRQHNKKLRKQKQTSLSSKKKKSFVVPNSLPFKEEVLKEAEDQKRRREEERVKHKERQRMERQKQVNKKRNLGNLVKDVQKRTSEFERKTAFVRDQLTGGRSAGARGGRGAENSLKAYYKEFKKVVEAADVVIQVLDARDPLGSRCPQVEESVLSAGPSKRLVLLLNKVDLVPRENVEAWLKYLRNEFPTVAFKASTQNQADKLSQSKVPLNLASEDLRKSSRCLGADVLMKLLNNYCRNKDIKTAISVGVVGFPNTGKSSVINSLKRSKACNVGAMPGITRSMQEVQLDKHIKLLDSPGIVMATSTTDASAVLKNCVKVEALEDPVPPVAAILRRCQKQQLMLQYKLGNFSDVNEFLSLLAKRLGKLKRGGLPDVNKAAKSVIQDWNSGKITYYTHPPESQSMSVHLNAEICKEMSKEFDIDSLTAVEEETLKGLRQASAGDMVIETEGPTAGRVEEGDEEEEDGMDDDDEDDEEEKDWEDEEGEEAMEDDNDELKGITVDMASKTKASKAKAQAKGKGKGQGKGKKAGKAQKAPAVDKVVSMEVAAQENIPLNKSRKMAFKKMKKERKKSDVLAGKLSDALEGALGGLNPSSGGADYDFDVDFK